MKWIVILHLLMSGQECPENMDFKLPNGTCVRGTGYFSCQNDYLHITYDRQPIPKHCEITVQEKR
jgi:hypothetical protein